MRNFLFVFIFLLSVLPVFSSTQYYPENVDGQSYIGISQYGISKIEEIEKSVYGRVYSGQNIIVRIERLEREVFNRTYPNSTIDQRINNVIYAYKRNAEVVHSKTDRINKFKSFLNGLGAAFIGVPTGYTPPVYSDPYSMPYYSIGTNGIGQHYGQYSDYYGPNGRYRQNHNYGNNSGVRIID